ncbi:MAG: TonB-dependent receptor [Halioglobus sp.]
MTKNRIFKLSAISAAVASTLIPVQVQAQLEEVIVTATRRAESIQDIPLNISALGGGTIKEQGLSSLGEAMQWVPGIHVIDQGSRAADRIIVRGLSASSVDPAFGNASGGTVATYVGEIPVYVDLKLNDMERIEVLLGPQGTLYGAGALGGAIRYIPNKPQFEETDIEIRGDLYQISEADDLSTDMGFTLNLPVGDTLAFRVNVDYLEDSGFIDYIYTVREPGVSNPDPDFSNRDDVNANLRAVDDVNDEETLSARAALRWNPTDWLDGTLTYYYQNQDAGGRTINGRDSLNTGKYESAYRFVEPSERENTLIALELTADLGFAELTSATGFSEYEESGSRDQTDLLITLEYSYEAFPSFAAFTQEDTDEERFNQEFRLVSTGDGPISWIAGAFYNTFDIDSADSSEFTPGFGDWAVDNFGGIASRPDQLEYFSVDIQETTEWAFYGELSYEITDRWDITLGGRYYDYEFESKSATFFPMFEALFGSGDIGPITVSDADFDSTSQADDGTLFKFNTSYDFTEDMMAYFTYSEGFRLGAGNGIGLCPDPIPPGQGLCALPDEFEYVPDETKNYELGLRSTWLDQRLTFNGAVYYIEWSDPQLDSVTENAGVSITINGDGAESTGVEFSFNWLMTDNFSVRGSYSYSKAELTDLAPGLMQTSPGAGFATINVDGEDGDRLPGSPEQQGSVYATYLLPMGDMDMSFNYGISAISDVLTKTGGRANAYTLSGFAIHNLSVALRADAWDVSLYADNLLDKYAETGVRQDPSYNQTVSDINGDDVNTRRFGTNVLRPLTVGLRATYRFDM